MRELLYARLAAPGLSHRVPCGRRALADGVELPAAPPNPAPVTHVTAEGVRIHRVQTGWVSVKQRFREMRGPAFLRVTAIVTDTSWTEWLPITFYVIEHPEGTLVFDTGETAKTSQPDYFDCDPGTRWFYLNQLRFAVAPEDELGPQLESLGINPGDVRWAVLSHLHSDHMGGMGWLSGAEFLVSDTDADGHRGALMCRLPPGIKTTRVTYPDGPMGAFEKSARITSDGNLGIVSTPGHTPGHQSVLYLENETFYFFAGDVVFDLERLENETALAGIVEQVPSARRSISRVEQQVTAFRTILLPAHDANTTAPGRFRTD